jgi:hypothetical protein
VIRELLHLWSVLRGRVPCNLTCTLNATHHRTDLTADEYATYRVHGKVLCPCGGTLLGLYADMWVSP